jgi:hypothetical protein
MSIKNSTFLDLKNLTFALIGREYLNTTAQFGRLVALWNQGAKRAYRASHYWDRHLVVGEPRTVSQGHVDSAEDSFHIYDAGEPAVNGLYQYSQEWNGHASYVLNVNSISFDVTRFDGIEEAIGTYKLDPSLDLGNPYYRGAWVNQTNPYKVLAYNDSNNAWDLYDIRLAGAQTSSGTSLGYFPYQSTGWSAGLNITFANFPDEAYFIDRNAGNNHWELQKVTGSNSNTIVLYKDGNGNIPSETVWEIVNGVNPTPDVHDVDNIDTFLRIYKQQPFEGSAVQEVDFHVRNGRAYIKGSSADQDIVYITYKNEYTPAYATDSEDGDDVPDEYMNYMAHYAAYTWQRSVEQNASENNFALSLGLVNQILEDELAKVEGQGIFNSNVARKFKTYRNYT